MNRFAMKSCISCAALTMLGVQSAAMGESVPRLSLGALSSHSLQATADTPPLETDANDQWRFDFDAWLWMVGFNGDIAGRGRTAEIDANFGDIIDGSDSLFAISGRLEVGYGKFAGFVDALYSDVGADDQTGPLGLADIEFTLEQTIIDFGLMYRIGEWQRSGSGAANPRNMTLDLYAGARFNSIELTIDPANLPARSASQEWFDPIVGDKFALPLSERWRFEVNGDIGGFGIESDFTWSTTAVFGYDFDLFGLPATVLAGYRAIGWDFATGSGDDEFVYDMIQHGPILGLSIRF